MDITLTITPMQEGLPENILAGYQGWRIARELFKKFDQELHHGATPVLRGGNRIQIPSMNQSTLTPLISVKYGNAGLAPDS